jgi:hypothetical protein
MRSSCQLLLVAHVRFPEELTFPKSAIQKRSQFLRFRLAEIGNNDLGLSPKLLQLPSNGRVRWRLLHCLNVLQLGSAFLSNPGTG